MAGFWTISAGNHYRGGDEYESDDDHGVPPVQPETPPLTAHDLGVPAIVARHARPQRHLAVQPASGAHASMAHACAGVATCFGELHRRGAECGTGAAGTLGGDDVPLLGVEIEAALGRGRLRFVPAHDCLFLFADKLFPCKKLPEGLVDGPVACSVRAAVGGRHEPTPVADAGEALIGGVCARRWPGLPARGHEPALIVSRNLCSGLVGWPCRDTRGLITRRRVPRRPGRAFRRLHGVARRLMLLSIGPPPTRSVCGAGVCCPAPQLITSGRGSVALGDASAPDTGPVIGSMSVLSAPAGCRLFVAGMQALGAVAAAARSGGAGAGDDAEPRRHDGDGPRGHRGDVTAIRVTSSKPGMRPGHAGTVAI
jgi:hypothetical protein